MLLEGSERRRVRHPDDRGPEALAIDDRGADRVSAEVEVGGFLIDDPDPTLAERRTIGKTPACDQG
jgi:hypothetical protein